jgi:hypothetical protein
VFDGLYYKLIFQHNGMDSNTIKQKLKLQMYNKTAKKINIGWNRQCQEEEEEAGEEEEEGGGGGGEEEEEEGGGGGEELPGETS